MVTICHVYMIQIVTMKTNDHEEVGIFAGFRIVEGLRKRSVAIRIYLKNKGVKYE